MSSRQRPGPTFPEAIARMRESAILYLMYVRNRPVWDLNGREIAPEVIALLTACADVEPAGDGLFAGMPCQTWRIRSTEAP